MGKRLAVFFQQFSFISKFFCDKNAKIVFFEEKIVLGVVFIKLTFRWLHVQTGLSDLKNTKQLKYCLWWILFAF